MSLYAVYDMQYCDRCGGMSPHSSNGKCQALHRKKPLKDGATVRARSALRKSKIGQPKFKPADERFAEYTEWGPVPTVRPDLGPCLLFPGADNDNGYGQFYYNGKNGYIHRFAWEQMNGAIPDGLTVDHLCMIRNCCNADHMELVDRLTNYLRGVAARTHCKNGHEFPADAPNKKCAVCRKETGRKSWERRSRKANGLPNRSIKYDQALTREVIARIRSAETTISQGAREIGCNPNYLGRRVWEVTKAAVFERDENRCQWQGCDTFDQPLDAHHRIGRGMGGGNRPEISFGMANLISLCRVHHEIVTVDPNRGQLLGLVIPRLPAVDPATVPAHTITGWVLLTPDGSRNTVNPPDQEAS